MSAQETPTGSRPQGQRPRVLVFVDYYLPGFKFGGPVRTLANMSARMASHYEFFVFTADRDEGDAQPYPQVPLNQWTRAEDAMVYYTADRSLKNILLRIAEIKPNLIYLNSFF